MKNEKNKISALRFFFFVQLILFHALIEYLMDRCEYVVRNQPLFIRSMKLGKRMS